MARSKNGKNIETAIRLPANCRMPACKDVPRRAGGTHQRRISAFCRRQSRASSAEFVTQLSSNVQRPAAVHDTASRLDAPAQHRRTATRRSTHRLHKEGGAAHHGGHSSHRPWQLPWSVNAHPPGCCGTARALPFRFMPCVFGSALAAFSQFDLRHWDLPVGSWDS